MYCEIVWIMLLGMLFRKTEGTIQGCGVISCGPVQQPQKLICTEDTFILIANITSQSDGSVDEHAFQYLGRTCMGRSSCPLDSFCRVRHTESYLKIIYFCIEDKRIEKQCNQPSEIRHRKGFIQSPGYPASTSRKTCQWRISVPKNFYVHIRLHEVENGRSTAQCEGGLRLWTETQCDNQDFDNSLICGEVRQNRDFIGCGNVTIELNDVEDLRFWLSFQVLEQQSPVILPLDLSAECPYGTSEETVLPVEVDPPTMIAGTPISRTTPESRGKADSNSTQDEKSLSPMDGTEKIALYVAVAIAAGSLTSLVIVIVVCIRRQRKQKSIQKPNHHYNERPLPPIEKKLQIPHQPSNTEASKAMLQVGYSHVIDELPDRNFSASSTTSAAYVEVDENAGVPKIVPVFNSQIPQKYEISRDKQAAEHVYSEPKESKSRQVYEEIANDSEPSPCLEHGDQVKLIKNAERSTDVVKRSSTGTGGPYATCDLLAQHIPYENTTKRTLSRSESDDSFEMTENEMYEPFKAVHV